MKFRIEAVWDAEAEIWVATSPDVLGLVVQGRAPGELIDKVRLVLPSLVEIGIEPGKSNIAVSFSGRGI